MPPLLILPVREVHIQSIQASYKNERDRGVGVGGGLGEHRGVERTGVDGQPAGVSGSTLGGGWTPGVRVEGEPSPGSPPGGQRLRASTQAGLGGEGRPREDLVAGQDTWTQCAIRRAPVGSGRDVALWWGTPPLPRWELGAYW